MSNYQREQYEKIFARLLNKALKKGKHDPKRALFWLDKRYRFLCALLLSRSRIETADAFMDVREHLEQRLISSRARKSEYSKNQVEKL